MQHAPLEGFCGTISGHKDPVIMQFQRNDEDVGNSQKSAQSKGFRSLLAPVSTGMMSTSLRGLKPGYQICNTSSGCKSDSGNGASAGHVVSLGGDSKTDYFCVADSSTDPLGEQIFRCRSGNYANKISCRQNAALLCSVTLTFCLCSAALVFCVYIHYQMRDQNQMVQMILKDHSSLREDYQALRDDYHKLQEQLDIYWNEREAITKRDKEISPQEANAMQLTNPIKDGEPVAESNDLRMESNNHLLQLLRSNGVSVAGSNIIPRRVKRSEADRLYIEGIVINYLRRMPKVHLKGIDNITSTTNYREYRERTNEYLVWQTDPDSFIHRGVGLKKVFHQHNRIKGIEIRQAGIYFVYSQVVVNGTNGTAGWRRDCAHQTVMLPYQDESDSSSRTPKVLLSGFLTQDAEGYYNNSHIPFPRDSSLQMGIFRLLRQSEIRVRVPNGDDDDCRRTLFSTDLHSSYFGLFRIS